MKKIFYVIILALFVPFMFSCNRTVSVPLSADLSEIVSEAEGGVYKISIQSSDSWTAMTDSPWIMISPANGNSSAECHVSIDSSLVSGIRSGIVRFRSTKQAADVDVKVVQSGYGYDITMEKDLVSIDNYAHIDDRTFTVDINTNLPFTVKIPDSAINWLKCEVPDVVFDRGTRPRTASIKFTWGINSIPEERVAEVRIISADESNSTVARTLKVVQKAAEPIVIGREGDSTAVLAIGRSLGLWSMPNSGDKMDNWPSVKLWEEWDEGYTPEKQGRVRAATFYLFSTREGIPYEVQYLTEAEELNFFSNINSFLYDLDPGEYITKLTKLKRLNISAYGISELSEDFKNLSNLESLDLSSNNFQTLPDILTPENFPNLHALYLNTCQRKYVVDLSNEVDKNLGGFKGKFPRRLLEWEKLDTLRLSVNYFEGEIPDMEDYEIRYTSDDVKEMNLPEALVGTPKVLPYAKYFAVNLNRLYGKIPDWLLYHPYFTDWNPYVLVLGQEGKASDGTIASFDNVPPSLDYYWNFYEGYKEHKDIYIND